jgi:glucose uptake protein
LTAFLALVTVVSWGLWIPMAQFHPGVHQGVRIFYATLANAVFAGAALLAGGGHLELGWRGFWLPLAGGVVWTAGNYSAFRATAASGLARAAGTWTPLNIVVAFVWGAALFGELDHFGPVRAAVLASALVVVLAGVLMIVRSQGSAGAGEPAARQGTGNGLWWACAAGVLWGSYFVPAQWAAVPASVANFPLALGILLSGSVLGLRSGVPLRLGRRVMASQLAAGALFGVGNLTLLGLVARVGTGVGFTIAQLSLLVNASVGIWVFHVPKPGSRQARTALAGVLVAGIGGCVIGALR